MEIVILLITVLVIVFIYKFNFNKGRNQKFEFTAQHRTILLDHIGFYHALPDEGRKKFEEEITIFLKRTRVTGIDVSIDETDKILVAASAIIPVFAFPEWRYNSITEVLIYPNSFNHNFETAGKERQILGMVGTGAMNGTMILSKQALHHGFQNEKDKQNTAIHEFVHLVDSADGAIDGIPESLLGKRYVLPWINLIAEEIKLIKAGKSDINPYGATNNAEFFAVASEYFFEQPQLLQSKHPELYAMLERIFSQKLSLKQMVTAKYKISRNDPCPCRSGKKFKNCCGAVHFAK
jgi:Mlc titration factor MtfA (ptsG expression regulator)